MQKINRTLLKEVRKVLVSVCTITYNHEDYIDHALKGAIAQKTDFDYEIVVGEDCSVDRTRTIVDKYAIKYPAFIKVITSEKNLGAIPNFIRTLNACQGKYIALCEGDDYWTDPLKLQKQVDFLEANHDFAICFHNARKLIQETGDDSRLFFNNPPKDVFTIMDIIEKNFIPTLTCVYRNKLFKEFPDWYYDAFPGDWPLHILNAQFGKIKYIDEIMGVYRIHEGGAVSMGKNLIYNYERYIKTFEAIEKGDEIKQKNIIACVISNFYLELSKLYVNEKNYTKAKNTILKCLRKHPFHSLKKTFKIISLSISILIKDWR